jgi:hypothetical protein
LCELVKINLINKKILIENGYDEYKQDHFQKKVKNAFGIKYFINIDYFDIELGEKRNHCGFELKTQFKDITKLKGTPNMNITLFPIENSSIIEVEKFVDDIWNKNKFPYYEVY